MNQHAEDTMTLQCMVGQHMHQSGVQIGMDPALYGGYMHGTMTLQSMVDTCMVEYMHQSGVQIGYNPCTAW